MVGINRWRKMVWRNISWERYFVSFAFVSFFLLFPTIKLRQLQQRWMSPFESLSDRVIEKLVQNHFQQFFYVTFFFFLSLPTVDVFNLKVGSVFYRKKFFFIPEERWNIEWMLENSELNCPHTKKKTFSLAVLSGREKKKVSFFHLRENRKPRNKNHCHVSWFSPKSHLSGTPCSHFDTASLAPELLRTYATRTVVDAAVCKLVKCFKWILTNFMSRFYYFCGFCFPFLKALKAIISAFALWNG